MTAAAMRPAELTAAELARYPAQGRALAVERLGLLQRLPLPYLIVVMRELNGYDWRFPAEQRRIEGQLLYLSQLQTEKLAETMRGFASLNLGEGLEKTEWVSNPAGALEEMTALLWSTHQMDAFREAAEGFSAEMAKAVPERKPKQPRLVAVVIGAEVERAGIPLFTKLRPHGVYLRGVKPEGGFEKLLEEVERRAKASAEGGTRSESFAHWYVDGGRGAEVGGEVTKVSYGALEPVRKALLEKTQRAIDSGGMGPERLRSMLAQLQPGDVGLGAGVLDHFELSLLTEGSGTQIFATTFVQWAAREALRRAEPETMLLRYAPRQQQQTMNAMLAGMAETGVDAEGSLVDADMGAYYTWLNLRRLRGAEEARFVAWFEGHGEAVAIGPGLPAGTSSDSGMDMGGVLKLLA